jgi:hypothetical protein
MMAHAPHSGHSDRLCWFAFPSALTGSRLLRQDPPKRICLRGDNQPYIVSPEERAIADPCYDPKFTKSNSKIWQEA